MSDGTTHLPELIKSNAEVLIVDDVPQNLTLLSHILTAAGYKVRTATNGESALASARQKVPDLILLDICMPGMGGFEACRRLKSESLTSNVPVIFISALSEAENKIQGFYAGAIDYITKPFDEIEVLARVRIHLDMRNLHQQLESMVAERTAELQKSNRALRMISRANKILVRAMDEFSLIQSVCKIVVEIGGYPFCWAGCPHNNHHYRLLTTTFAPDGTADQSLADALSNSLHNGSTIIDVFQSGVPKIIKDINAKKEKMSLWEQAASHIGLSCCALLPLRFDEQIYGVLAVMTDHPEKLESSEIELLVELGNDLAFGIHTLRDRREFQLAQKALVESEQRYRQLFEKAGDAVFIIHAEGPKDGLIVQANQAAAEMHGYSVDELISTPIQNLFSPSEQEKDLERTQRILAGEWVHEEIEHQKKDGTVFPVEISAGLIEIGDQRFILAFDHDISDRKRFEAENAALETQIRQANKMEAIGTLASGIAHDFNNILSAASGYTELSIPLAPPDSILSKNLHRIQDANKRAAELVRHILTLSREREASIQALQPQMVIKEAIKLLRASLPTTIAIKQEIKSNGYIMGDPAQVHQIIMNLCVNAGHAMETTGGVLSISLIDEELDETFTRQYVNLQPGPYVVLTVSDTGIGIEHDILDKIFDPYFTTKPQGKGTGLGLSVVLGIVDNYRGAVSVTSEKGQGTCFRLYLPAVVAEEQTKMDVSHPIPRGTERILFVDDEPSLVEIGQQILQLLGYQVTTQTDSTEALALYRENPQVFDLLITDYTMPKMTGIQLSAAFLKITPQLPVILMSGLETANLSCQAEQLGIRGLLRKPILIEEIAVLIRSLLDTSPSEKIA